MTFILIDADADRRGLDERRHQLGSRKRGILCRRDPKEQRAGSPLIARARRARASTPTDGAFLGQVDWFRVALIDRSTQREPDCQRPHERIASPI